MSEFGNGDRVQILNRDNATLRTEIRELKKQLKVKHGTPSPRGHIDVAGKGGKDIAKAGLGVGAPVGAWSGEVRDFMDGVLYDTGVFSRAFLDLGMIEYVVGGVAGMIVAGFMATVYKVLKDYK